jgi:hypothetical protein
MPDDHSEVVPLLPIPNRTVKRLCADDSADSRVKVGHRQALTAANARPWRAFAFVRRPSVSWAFCIGKPERRRQAAGAEKTLSQFARPASLAGSFAQVLASCTLSFDTTSTRFASEPCQSTSFLAMRSSERWVRP